MSVGFFTGEARSFHKKDDSALSVIEALFEKSFDYVQDERLLILEVFFHFKDGFCNNFHSNTLLSI
jgi:hypothetical protein